MANQKLIEFIREARKRGFSDKQILTPLLEKGWPLKQINESLNELHPKQKYKNQVCIFLSDEILTYVEKRAKKNKFNLQEQIEDVLRRSCVNKSKTTKPDKNIDDLLVKCFSRAQRKKKSQ